MICTVNYLPLCAITYETENIVSTNCVTICQLQENNLILIIKFKPSELFFFLYLYELSSSVCEMCLRNTVVFRNFDTLYVTYIHRYFHLSYLYTVCVWYIFRKIKKFCLLVMSQTPG